MKSLAEIKADLQALPLPIGLLVVDTTADLQILFANDHFVNMLGFRDEDDFMQTHQSAWSCVCPLDAEPLIQAAANRRGSFTSYKICYRMVKKDGGYIWVSQSSRHCLDENGRELVFAYYNDITAQKQMAEDILIGSQKNETLINSIPGGVGMYKWDAQFTPIFISNRVYELCGMTGEEYREVTRHSTLDILHPDDRQGLAAAVQTAFEEKRKFDYTHRLMQKDGTWRWVRVSGEVLPAEDGVPVLYTVFSDVNDRIRAEQALRESELRYASAVKSSRINIWEYDYASDELTFFSKSPRIHSQSRNIPGFLQSVINGHYLREDSVKALWAAIDRMQKGQEELTLDVWIHLHVGDPFWCERISCSNLFDAAGKPVRAYCVGRDVTKEKEAEKRYQDELSYREAMQKVTLASINVNLTKNIILDYKSNFPVISARIRTAKTAQAYFDQLYTELTTKEMQQQCASVFSRDALLSRFAAGETTLSLELSRKIEGRRYSTILTAHMMQQVEDREIVAFLYSTDITNERTMQKVMDAIVKTDYDFLVVVDSLRNTAVRYSESSCINAYANESNHFLEETREYICRYICQADVPRVLSELTFEKILAHLEKDGTYTIFYRTPAPTGGHLKKQLHFSFIDSELGIFLMTRTDITAAVAEQKKKNRELVAAVEMAEHANAAKSEFLSRISHEIRTPMNAIIGLAQVALQNLDDKDFVVDCIVKSQYSSQYLLLLLNDILDMAKIDSGKIELQEGPILCDQFLYAIHTIVGAQAASKDVAYVVTEFEGRKSSYWGDGVRLQQILINILSNSVKFTPPGGTIRLNTSQTDIDETHTQICFQISDTGIGIGAAFLPRIFEPFSQEHNGTTGNYGGSGLGLAISKHLAQLMGGDITVQSTAGKGTTFSVCIPLGVPDASPGCREAAMIPEDSAVYNFSQKRFLLVEDHQLNVMVAKKLLEFKNASVDVAENGAKGLAMFADAPEHTYDAVLMDIRMPVMDGLEAARGIRSLDSPWAKAVPILALSANAYAEDIRKSKEAGMNVHLRKPVDPQTLYRTLSQLLENEEEVQNG